MYTRDLKNILKNVPIILQDKIVWKDEDGFYEAESLSLRHKKGYDRLTILNYNCDDLAKTLLYESLHHDRPLAEEEEIEDFTDFLWERPEHRKMFQDKIVQKLGEYNL